MKHLYVLLFTAFTHLFAEAFLISNIPLPKTYIFNLDPYPCDEQCLDRYLEKGLVFSFLANANDTVLQEHRLQDAKNMYISVFNLGSTIMTNKLKIAMLLPYKKIGKYATSTTNAAFAYLMARNFSFELKSFSIEDESAQAIREALKTIQSEGFFYVIAPLTLEGAKNLVTATDVQINVYFPTIHKNDLQTDLQNIYFGAIDYQAQSKALLREAADTLVIFYDRSYIGKKLTQIQESIFVSESLSLDTMLLHPNSYAKRKIIKFPIATRTTNLEKELKDNVELIGASVMLDTPLVKSGMIMSQLTLYDIKPSNILSTQINYDPLILSITQYEDRKGMIIANSITQRNNVLIQTNALLGNDIVYDWINYATTVGIDLFFSMITSARREYDIPLVENQMLYPIELKEPSLSRFIPYYSEKPIDDAIY